VQVVAEQVSQVTVQTQLELQAVQVDSVVVVQVLDQHRGLAEQGFSTFSTRRHYDLQQFIFGRLTLRAEVTTNFYI
jgi:hypothetical protein